MENKEIVIKGKGIKVSVLLIVFIAIGVMIMISSIFMIKAIYDKYDEMTNSYQFIEEERDAALNFKAASDYLTDQARKFAVTGNISNAENYFEEKDFNRRRDISIERIKNSDALELEYYLLADAMEMSENLVKQELHAMKLAAIANRIDNNQLPEEVASFELPARELSIEAAEQKDLAIQLLYNNDYEKAKDKIDWDIENAIVLTDDESGTKYRENEADLIFILNIATLHIFALFILVMLIFIFNSLLVINPARKFTALLDKKEKLPEIGGYEFREFARKYNDVYRSNKKNRELLIQQGEVDKLTGTLKVGTLEFVRNNLSQSDEPIGIMMIDIDNFRSIKEANGYDMADRVVAKVAELFKTSFKSSDYIIRTSQDEFEIFLLKMKQSDSEMLENRISEINKKLQNTEDGVIAASVSVGVSFSEKGYTVEAERKADMALNSVKENGRGACKIS